MLLRKKRREITRRATQRKLNETTSPILKLSLHELARKLRDGSLSSKELVRRCLMQSEQTKKLNAVVQLRSAADCFREAAAADKLLKQWRRHGCPAEEEPHILCGIPFLVKESVMVSGMPHTAGLVVRAGITADRDAVPIAMLRKHGAIVLGVTNLSEMAIWNECSNNLYGRCRNPYDRHCTTGGSSGGSAAAVAAYCVPYAVGSDIAGSTRFPAFCCGIYGHKPSALAVSNDGQYPPCTPRETPHRYGLNTLGILTRSAADLWPILKTLSDNSGIRNLPDPSTIDLSEYRILYLEDSGVPFLKPCRVLQKVQRQAIGILKERCGMKLIDRHDEIVEFLKVVYLRYVNDMWLSMYFTEDQPPIHELLMGNLKDECPVNHKFKAGKELVKYLAGKSNYTIMSILNSFGDMFYCHKPKPHLHDLRMQLELEIARLFKQYRYKLVIVASSFVTPAPLRHRTKIIPESSSSFLSLFNILGLPCTQTPLGRVPLQVTSVHAGLPLGFQVASHYMGDNVTIRVAMELNKAYG